MCGELSVSMERMTRLDIAPELVRRLVDAQFPQWSHLDIRPVAESGWDNRTFRLGHEFVVRMPSAAGYEPQVDKEHRWLPVLASRLPLPIPVPIARGRPGEGYPFEWSVYPWIDGEPARRDRIADLPRFAEQLAAFLRELRAVPADGGPRPGLHSAYRGGPLEHYDAETRAALVALEGQVDTSAARAIWDEALASPFEGSPVWFHGDIAVGNLLVREGELAAVLDFGCAGVGDPACDGVIAWTLFDAEAAAVYREALGVDEATWARARGWAVWKALIVIRDADVLPNGALVEHRAALARLLEER